jgi:hypothetical protein
MDVIAVNSLDEAFGSMPRALMVDKQGQRWLVGTDGSTKRVYYMRAPRRCQHLRTRPTRLWRDLTRIR